MSEGAVDQELQGLLVDLLDGELDDEARRRLNDRLRDDPEAQQLYLAFCEMHAALSWEHGLVLADVSPPAPDRVDSKEERRLRLWPAASAIGALAAMIAFAFIWFPGGSGQNALPRGPVVAEIDQRINADIRAADAPWQRDHLQVGVYHLDRGLIRLNYQTGVRLLIEAPAEFEAVSDDRIILHRGRLAANVPPAGVGFVVETAEAKVVDFGTEFGIEAGQGQSEVHVFEGHVQVEPKGVSDVAPRDAKGERVDLRTAQAVRIADTTMSPAGIDLATDRFIRSLDEPVVTYPKRIEALSPIAYYRMPIRNRGLLCSMSEHDGEVLTGTGRRPPWAPGVVGSSLRVGGRSLGRGGKIARPPKLNAQEMSILVWVRADSRTPNATVLRIAGSADHEQLSLQLDEFTMALTCRLKDSEGALVQVTGAEPVELGYWLFVAITHDGESLRLYRNGELVDEKPCDSFSSRSDAKLWIGTGPDGIGLWDGRIDELAFFDRALTREDIESLFNVLNDTAASRRK